MFRAKQKFETEPCIPVLVPQTRVLESGICEDSFIDASKIVLPAVETFDLDVLLKAGVNLQKVNCKLLSPSSATVNLNVEKDEQTNKEN